MSAMEMLMTEEEIDPELLCEVHEDGRCKNEATRIVHEPYTPGRFRIRCCDEHAEGLIRFGYKPANGITCNQCGGRIDADRDEAGTCLDCEEIAIRKERQQQEAEDYAARRSQYSHLIHESVMKANEIVIELNGDWGVRK